MTARVLTTAAAASLSAVAVLGFAAPALAQTAPCYPPPCAAEGGSVSDTTAEPGQTVTVQSGAGAFDAGTPVSVDVLGITGTTTADAAGEAVFTFTVPTDAPAGPTAVTFSGVSNGAATGVTVPFTVVGTAAAPVEEEAPAAAPGDTGAPAAEESGVLPTTGSDAVVPLTLAGVALVLVGGGIVTVARSRRRAVPTSFA